MVQNEVVGHCVKSVRWKGMRIEITYNELTIFLNFASPLLSNRLYSHQLSGMVLLRIKGALSMLGG
jgi:hypothetical protein